ncbi:hypothetical protein [Methanobacterium sp. MBAC-LM]|uniref:hypothetical protein n=1 Tax=Methanobacterium sp. MBAC-LM TaxID=3412034 RepID=UPI003C72AB1F
MSIYDHRDRSAYMNVTGNPDYCNNAYILKWWTKNHDILLEEQIKEKQWSWYWEIKDEILKITPNERIEKWISEDPLCTTYAWYNILMYFAISRAEKLGLTEIIRKPERKKCPLCNKNFIENSLPYPLIKRLGINQIDFCAPCLKDTVLFPGIENLSKEKTMQYIRNLVEITEIIPPQNYGSGMNDLHNLTTEKRLKLLKLLKQKPKPASVKKLFGSWFNALIDAGILEYDSQRMVLGTRCLAKDKHVCYSLAEKTIDDFLYTNDIIHDKEPKYPEGNFRADFKVNNTFVEYFGLMNDKDYNLKAKYKKELCKKHNIKLISIYPKDLVNQSILKKKFSDFL